MVGELHVNLIKKSAELKLLLKINYNLDDMEIIIVYSRSREEEKKKQITFIYSNTNYRKKMKLVPIIMYYCPLQFDALNVFLKLSLHGGLCLN